MTKKVVHEGVYLGEVGLIVGKITKTGNFYLEVDPEKIIQNDERLWIIDTNGLPIGAFVGPGTLSLEQIKIEKENSHRRLPHEKIGAPLVIGKAYELAKVYKPAPAA